MGNETESILWKRGWRINSKNEWYKPPIEARGSPPSPQPEPPVRDRTNGEIPRKEGDPEIRKVSITYTSHRRRLIDPENLTTKYLTDALRYEGIIQDDSAKHVEITVRQEKVNEPQSEFTEIKIEEI